MSTVICVGIAVMDQIFSVAQLPTTPGKHFAEGFMEIGGGPAANAAVTAARLGARAAFCGRVGADQIGTRIIAGLQAEQVDTTQVRRIEGAPSTLSAVFVDAQGERMLVSHASPNLDTDPGWLPRQALSSADAILVDVRWPQGAEAALRLAREASLPAVLDADLTPGQDIGELVKLASHVAFSEQALHAFTGLDDPGAGLRRVAGDTDAWVCVTAGAQGCYFLESGKLQRQPAFPVQAVDTLAAGDVFHGALAVALAEGQTGAASVRFASAAAALKCTRFGGRAGIPQRAEVDALLEAHQT